MVTISGQTVFTISGMISAPIISWAGQTGEALALTPPRSCRGNQLAKRAPLRHIEEVAKDWQRLDEGEEFGCGGVARSACHRSSAAHCAEVTITPAVQTARPR